MVPPVNRSAVDAVIGGISVHEVARSFPIVQKTSPIKCGRYRKTPSKAQLDTTECVCS